MYFEVSSNRFYPLSLAHHKVSTKRLVYIKSNELELKIEASQLEVDSANNKKNITHDGILNFLEIISCQLVSTL